MSDKPITYFNIEIGAPTIGGLPICDPFITFYINEKYMSCRLGDLKEWIDEIYSSNGDRNEDAYKAFHKLQGFFAEMLSPFMDLEHMANLEE